MNNGVVSIGGDCNSRILIKSELGYSKANGYKTCPFDLLFSTFVSARYHVETDFAEFFDGLHVIPDCPVGCEICVSGPHAGCGLISNRTGIVFEHESPTHAHLFEGKGGHGGEDYEWASAKNDTDFFIRNDFAKLKEKYKERIDNFRCVIKDNEEIIMVRSPGPDKDEPSADEVNAFIACLEKRYIGKKFIVLPSTPTHLRGIATK